MSYVINRWSCRVAAIISGVCMLLGFSLSYFAPNLIFLIATFGAISGESLTTSFSLCLSVSLSLSLSLSLSISVFDAVKVHIYNIYVYYK